MVVIQEATRWLARHRIASSILGLIGVGFLAAAVAIGAPAASASVELSAIKAQLSHAIQTDFDQGMLGTGIRPAHLSSSEQAALAKSLQDQALPTFSKAFTGQALTDRVSNHLAWAKEASTSGAAVILSYEIKSFSPDDPIVAGDTATVTGTYVVHFKNGQDAPNGMVTWGGTSTQVFTGVLTRVNGVWLVSSYAERQEAEVENSEDFSGWDNLPSPSPKSAPSTFVPMPVKP